MRGGGLLPLGGEGVKNGGYKGYGLAVLVDILTGICSGGDTGAAVRDSAVTSARVCHFFMALRVDIFRPAMEFKRDLSLMLDELARLEPAEGADRVYYAGQRGLEREARANINGIDLDDHVWQTLREIGQSVGLK